MQTGFKTTSSQGSVKTQRKITLSKGCDPCCNSLAQLKPQLATHNKNLQDYLTQFETLGDVDMFSIEQVRDHLSVYEELIQAETGYPQSVLAQVEMTHQSQAVLQQIGEQSADIQAVLSSLKGNAKSYFD